MKAFGVAFLLVFVPIAPLVAQTGSLRCDIVEVTETTFEGTRVEAPLQHIYADEQLIIDLETGKVFHGQFGNLSFTERMVVDKGSNQSSLKIVALSAEGKRGDIAFRNMSIIQVQTYATGSKKPFMALTGSTFATGFCQ